MPYLIDGHNLIGQTPGLSLADPDDERKLVELLRTFLVKAGKKGTVVFDQGQPGATARWSNNVLKVVFARAPSSADDLIRHRLATEVNPQGLLVITGDQEVARAARAARARVQSAAEFAQEMLRRPATSQKKEVGLTEDEVLAWEKEFKKGRG